MPIFNPAPASSSSGGNPVPLIVANGVTFTVATNTQVPHPSPILTQAGGIVLVVGTGQLVFVS